MATLEYAGKVIETDDEGYLLDFEKWNEQAACALAEKEGVEELTKDRMEIIKFMRDYYRTFRSFPILGAVCKNVHQDKACVTEQFMDPLKAWKVAGLPAPGPEVLSYITRKV